MVDFCNFWGRFVLTRLEGQLCEWLSSGALESPGAVRQRPAPGRRGVILTRSGISLTLCRESRNDCAATASAVLKRTVLTLEKSKC